MSILSILQTSVRPSPILTPQALEDTQPRAEETKAKDPQPFSSGPPPSPVEASSRFQATATQSRNDAPPAEPDDALLDDETQSALIDASGRERLDRPRMSASLASAMLMLNAKPASMMDLLAGNQEGPSFVEQAYSQLAPAADPGAAGHVPYDKSA